MLTLTPRIAPLLESALNQEQLLRQLVQALGSPLNVVLPQQLTENVARFHEVYRRRRLSGRLYFAHKANRSTALLRQLAATDAGVDVASLGELEHALACGFGPGRILATGPKNHEFLWLAARTGVTVNADSTAELAGLASIVTAFGFARIPVMARLSGFAAPGVPVQSRRSRFGIPADEIAAVAAAAGDHERQLEFTGVSYHLDTVGLPEKAAALEGCLKAVQECRDRGLQPSAIDIGGGFGVNYLADAGEWERYTSALVDAVLGRRVPLTWDGHGYGLRNEGGKVGGSLALYPAHRPIAGPAYLERLLDTKAPTLGRSLGDLLLDTMTDLHIEPGRALLDQCGLVLATVVRVAEDARGDTLVSLDLNARDVDLEAHGVLMDPILIGGSPGPAGVFLTGNLCLESDLITRRRVFLPATPRPGDLLAFVNTAGYLMDFNATHASRQPVARKVAMCRESDCWRWCLDERYWPSSVQGEPA